MFEPEWKYESNTERLAGLILNVWDGFKFLCKVVWYGILGVIGLIVILYLLGLILKSI